MNGRRKTTSGGLVALAVALVLLGGASPAMAAGPADGVQVCDQFGSTPVAGGRYEVQNDVWGADTPQCVTAFDTGFVVDPADHHKEDSPAAYPSIVFGCNYGNCTKDSTLPRSVGDLGNLRSSWAVTLPPTGDYNAAYDIWLDPTARVDGANTGLELMIWLDHTDRVQPLGEKQDQVTIGGKPWDVWVGENGGTPVVSYVSPTPLLEVTDLPLKDFVADTARRGITQPGWFLTSVQAGFEPWIGGAGLTTRSFSVDL